MRTIDGLAGEGNMAERTARRGGRLIREMAGYRDKNDNQKRVECAVRTYSKACEQIE